MVIRELTYQLHKLEASESALVSADHHDKKSVLGIGGKNPDRSIPSFYCIYFIIHNVYIFCLLIHITVEKEFATSVTGSVNFLCEGAF